ncbi:tetratricopeptide repeat protein [Umezawaea endophytica]|uniref:Tetratricopeptide repeat protein n=1 Tax=Umezawaea endophytica TaxID=1654476 RepID=A0A9X2VUZ7_9PSEU|nr:tetratricopeptide repeat protein [Umezawaea endophytica]MCS7482832.1 tetratricopeptide repeat protein [Umezawaea endophytica]
MRWRNNAPRSAVGGTVHNSANGNLIGPVVQTGAVHGDVHVTSAKRGYALRSFPGPEHSALPEPSRRQPSQLLLARNEVVDFIGRESDLRELDRWRRGAARIDALLLHAPGGFGKTRLAVKFAARSVAAGWTVAFAQHGSDPGFAACDGISPTGAEGLLVVVDYADRWPRSDLLALVEDVRLRHNGARRILLLARSPRRCWDLLQYPLRKLGVSADARRLPELATDLASRREVFTAARNRFAEVFGVDAEGVRPLGSLDHSAYGSVLTIHMAALVAVDASDRRRLPPTDPGALSEYLLHREIDHWAAMRETRAITSGHEELARAAFIATLVGPVSHREGVAVLRGLGVAASDCEAGRILADHSACYPPADDQTVLEPVYPDRLGEDFLAYCLPTGTAGRDGATRMLDPWTVDVAARLIDEGVPHGQLITVLTESGKRWPHVGAHLRDLLLVDPGRAVTAGGAALMAVANAADIRVLAAIEPLLPDHHADLDPAAAALVRRLTDYRLVHTRSPEARARLLIGLGWRLGNAGAFDQALRTTEPAVRIYRELAADHPSAHEPGLALSLHHLGTHLAGIGRKQEALEASQEAVAIRKRLAEADPCAHEADLASSLNNLAADLSEVNLRELALATIEEAVDIHRRLAAHDPTAHEPTLAATLNNLGMHLAGVQRTAKALDVAEEAVRLYRNLAARDPHVFSPDLASALHNLGTHRAELGHLTAALDATEEAVLIRTRLAVSRRVVFEAELAASLHSLATTCAELGFGDRALSHVQNAIDHYERLHFTAPEIYAPKLAACLHNQGAHLSRAGKLDDAAAASRRAVAIRADIAEAALSRYEELLAEAMLRLGVRLPGPSLLDEKPSPAVSSLQRSVNAIVRSMDPGNVQSTRNLEIRLARAARLTAVVTSASPVVEGLLALGQRELARVECGLARTLSALSSRLVDIGKGSEALKTSEQAVSTCRRLVAVDPVLYRPDLISCLVNHGVRLAESGHRDHALKATEYAVSLLGWPSAIDLGSSTAMTACALRAYAWVRLKASLELESASDAMEQAHAIYRRLARDEPSAFGDAALATRRTMTARLGDPDGLQPD